MPSQGGMAGRLRNTFFIVRCTVGTRRDDEVRRTLRIQNTQLVAVEAVAPVDGACLGRGT